MPADLVESAIADVSLSARRRMGDAASLDDELTWLYRIAYPIVANHPKWATRRRRVQAKLIELGIASGVTVPEQIIIREEAGAAVQLLGGLKHVDQEVVRLSVWEELSNSQIASVLGISERAVARRLNRAVERLGKEFENAGLSPVTAVQSSRRRESFGEQVLTLIGEANPIPDPESLTVGEFAGTDHSATEPTPTEMRQLDRPTKTPRGEKRSRRRIGTVLVVGIATALYGIAAMFISQLDEDSRLPAIPSADVVDEFEGVWQSGQTLIEFDGDVYYIARGAAVVDQGTFSTLPASRVITFRSNSLATNCADGSYGSFEYAFGSGGALTFNIRSDDCYFDRFLREGESLAGLNRFHFLGQ